MANAIPNAARARALKAMNGTADISADAIKCVLVDLLSYTYSASHTALSDIPVGARTKISGNMTGITYANGVFDCNDFVFSTVTGNESEALYWYFDSGVEATSYLLHYQDTGITGIPVTPNGGDINVSLNASGLFSIGG